MTHAELTDTLVFLSAMQMLKRLVERELLTEDEAEVTRQELRRRLRPCI